MTLDDIRKRLIDKELGMLRAFQPPPNSALPVLGGLFSVPVPPDTIV